MAAPRSGSGGGLGQASNVSHGPYKNEGGGYGRGGGIKAKNYSGAPSGDAADAAKKRKGRASGQGAAAGATADGYTPAFGISGGMDMNPAGGGRRGKMPAADAANQRGKKTMPLSDHVPAHTFGASTIPRSTQMKSPARYDPDNDGDNDASASGDTDHDYVLPDGSPGPKARRGRKQASAPLRPGAPVRSREMAAPQKKLPKQMIKPSRAGLFTAKAKAAGMGVQEFANHVLAAKQGAYDPATRRQANFARNFGGAAKARAK